MASLALQGKQIMYTSASPSASASAMATEPLKSSYGLPFLKELDTFKNMEKDLFSGNNYQLIIAEINNYLHKRAAIVSTPTEEGSLKDLFNPYLAIQNRNDCYLDFLNESKEAKLIGGNGPIKVMYHTNIFIASIVILMIGVLKA